jgi:hypothetical protein
VALRGERLVDGDQRRFRLDLDHRQLRRPARRIAGRGGHGKHHLPMEFDRAVGKNRVVMGDRPDIVGAGDIRRGEHRDDARRRPHRIEVQPHDFSARDRRSAERHMQGALGLAHVVDIDR